MGFTAVIYRYYIPWPWATLMRHGLSVAIDLLGMLLNFAEFFCKKPFQRFSLRISRRKEIKNLFKLMFCTHLPASSFYTVHHGCDQQGTSGYCRRPNLESTL